MTGNPEVIRSEATFASAVSGTPNSLKVIPDKDIRDKREQNVWQRVLLVSDHHVQHPKAANG